jgi:SAM-dependent methyltransferase
MGRDNAAESSDINDRMDSSVYSNKGRIYNYERHPKGEVFLDKYFALPPLENFVKEIRGREGPQKVLDLGSGTGKEANRLRKILPAAKVFSADISSFGSRMGKKSFQLEQVQADIIEPPFASNQFDSIHCKDVFVHVQDKDNFFENISRMLKEDGLFLLVSSGSSLSGYKQFGWNMADVEDRAEKRIGVGVNRENPDGKR